MPRRRSLVIVESGARAPLALDLEDIVLVQHVGEAPRAFSQRVVARHRELSQAGTLTLERALLAVGHGRCEEALSARYRIARTVIAGSQSTGTSELTFLAPCHHAPSARHELRALANVLEESLFGSDFHVRVELTDQKPAEAAPPAAAA